MQNCFEKWKNNTQPTTRSSIQNKIMVIIIIVLHRCKRKKRHVERKLESHNWPQFEDRKAEGKKYALHTTHIYIYIDTDARELAPIAHSQMHRQENEYLDNCVIMWKACRCASAHMKCSAHKKFVQMHTRQENNKNVLLFYNTSAV